MIKSAGIVFIKNQEILLIKPGGIQSPRQWSIPKGIMDEGENIIDTAIRETYEETGILVPVERIDVGQRSLISYVDHEGVLKKVIFYFIVQVSEAEYREWRVKGYDAAEVAEMRFFSKKEAKEHLYWKQWPLLNHLDVSKYDLEDLGLHVRNGLVSKVKHPQLPLWMYNITAYCKQSRCWNYTTLSCRGLILDEAGMVVGRPFKKFFEEREMYPEVVNILPEKVMVTEKMDGALGIMYWYKDVAYITCKNRFGHYMEGVASDVLHGRSEAYKGLTLLFEIISARYPFTVYYPFTDVVLIGAVETETGREVPLKEFEGQFMLPEMIGKDREGDVVMYADGTRVKVKTEAFMRRYTRMKEMKRMVMDGGACEGVEMRRWKAVYEGYWVKRWCEGGVDGKEVYWL